MADGTLSPDGKYLWTGTEWIPAPPKNIVEQEPTPTTSLNLQDSVMSGDIIHNTVVNNDTTAVTTAVIEALKELGVLDSKPKPQSFEMPFEKYELPPSFQVGDHVEYYSPTNSRWIDRCTVVGINPDGTYRITVPKSTATEIKPAVVIGTSPGTIRPAKPPFSPGDRVLVNWKNYGTYYPATISKEYENHTFLILFDDGDVEDQVEWGRIESADVESESVQNFLSQQSNELEEIIQAFEVFDEQGNGTISAQKYFEILTMMGENPLSEEDVLEEFSNLGINMDAELDYRELAKSMVGDEAVDELKAEVVIRDAEIKDGILHGHAYNHPALGEGPLQTSQIVRVVYDSRATAHVETQNTVYVVGPTGWKTYPEDHPFNDEANEYYTVHGAGTSKCNGTYIPGTTFDGVPSYINGDVLLLRWKMGNGDQWWYLADRNSLDTKRGDYYRVKSSADRPPTDGWVTDDQTEGLNPCPVISNSSKDQSTTDYFPGQQVKVEWNGSWWDALVRDSKEKSYLIHYVGFDTSWDEWVEPNRIKTSD